MIHGALRRVVRSDTLLQRKNVIRPSSARGNRDVSRRRGLPVIVATIGGYQHGVVRDHRVRATLVRFVPWGASAGRSVLEPALQLDWTAIARQIGAGILRNRVIEDE